MAIVMAEKWKIDISEVCEKALSDLEKIEVQFTVEETSFKNISGSMILHLHKITKTTH